MRLTGSRYHLAVLCAYGFRPDVEVVERPVGKSAEVGTETHSFVESSLAGHDMSSLFFGEDATRIGTQAVTWLATQPKHTACEIKLVYHAVNDTARIVDDASYPGPRNYGPLANEEIPVTLDLVWVESDSVTVRDLKTGKKENAHREQLLVQALAASRFYGKSKARIGFLFARKTKVDPTPLEDLDETALDEASWEVARVLLGTATARPMRGQHCWFCDARPVCPAHEAPTDEERTEMNA